MTKPSIIITGANGFIGESLVVHFRNLGWIVKALVHAIPQKPLDDVVYIKYDLEEKHNEAIFESADFLVHCAYLKYEKNKNSDSINVNGTKELIRLCRKNNCKIIFLSSFSAHEKAESHYGKTKLQCEKLFDTEKDVILKPGLILGNGGLAGEIISRMKTSSFFPLVGGGKQVIQTIYIADLCQIIELACDKKIAGLFHIAETKAITLKEFYTEVLSKLNGKVKFISVSSVLLYFMCKCSETFGIKLPVSSESVLGLKQLRAFETELDLNKLGVTIRNYKQSIQELIH